MRFTEAGANTKGCPPVPSVSKIKNKKKWHWNKWMDGWKEKEKERVRGEGKKGREGQKEGELYT